MCPCLLFQPFQGAAIMNNTFCLGIFLGLVWPCCKKGSVLCMMWACIECMSMVCMMPGSLLSLGKLW